MKKLSSDPDCSVKRVYWILYNEELTCCECPLDCEHPDDGDE